MTIQTIMTNDESGKELVEYAQTMGRTLANSRLTTAQIRSIFSEVRQIEALWKMDDKKALRRLNLLKPKLAYQGRRQTPVKELEKVLAPAIDEVEKAADKNKSFKRFIELFEAILAYHKAESR